MKSVRSEISIVLGGAAGTCPATGGVIVAESSSDEKGFDSDKILSLFKNEKATVVSGSCYSLQYGQLTTFSGLIHLDTAVVTSIYLLSVNDSSSRMTCDSSNKTCGMYPLGTSGQYLCTGGWKIYAQCPAN